jgi:hypothetical protein
MTKEKAQNKVQAIQWLREENVIISYDYVTVEFVSFDFMYALYIDCLH